TLLVPLYHFISVIPNLQQFTLSPLRDALPIYSAHHINLNYVSLTKVRERGWRSGLRDRHRHGCRCRAPMDGFTACLAARFAILQPVPENSIKHFTQAACRSRFPAVPAIPAAIQNTSHPSAGPQPPESYTPWLSALRSARH